MGKFDGAIDQWNRYKDRKEQWEDLQNVIPEYEPPPDHLWNIPGTDIWVTPNEPVEPGDCERWPESCDRILDPLGGLSNTELSPGLDFETSYSECSICITITPNLGPISLPPYTICRIKEECQEPEEEIPSVPYEDNSGFHPPSPVPQEWQVQPFERLIWFYLDGATSQEFNTLFDQDGNAIDRNRSDYTQTSNVNLNNYTFVRYRSNNGLTILNPPFYGYLYGYNDGSTFVVRVPAFWKLKTFIKNYENGNWNQAIPYFELPDGSTRSCYWNPIDETPGETTITNGQEPNSIIIRRQYLTSTIVPIDGYNVRYIPTLKTSYFALRPSELPVDTQQPISRPSPIPTPDPQIMPSCCDLDSVLAAIKKLKKSVDRIEKVIAPQEFYEIKRDGSLGRNICSIPKRFMYPLSSGQQPVKNYAELIEFLMRQIDRNNGASSWEVVIEDSDPDTPGNQKLPIQVHSLNDGLKAILQFLIDQATAKNGLPALTFENVMWNQKALVCMGYDLASVKKMMVIDNHILQNIEDHMDYKVDQKEIQVPFGVNPVLNNFSHEWKNTAIMKSLFNPKKHTVVITENIDKIGLGETLNQISRNAAIAASPQVQQYKDGIVDKLVDAAETEIRLSNAVLLSEMKKQLGIVEDEEMKKWVEDAEKAYIPTGGNQENEQQDRQQQNVEVGKYYGNKRPAAIINTTKRSRRRRRRQNG